MLPRLYSFQRLAIFFYDAVALTANHDLLLELLDVMLCKRLPFFATRARSEATQGNSTFLSVYTKISLAFIFEAFHLGARAILRDQLVSTVEGCEKGQLVCTDDALVVKLRARISILSPEEVRAAKILKNGKDVGICLYASRAGNLD